MNSYLLVYGMELEGRLLIKLNRSSFSWLRLWPGALIIKSNEDLNAVTDWIHGQCPDSNFILSRIELNKHSAGWMPQPVWTFLREPA